MHVQWWVQDWFVQVILPTFSCRMSTFSYNLAYFYGWELPACLYDITCFEICGMVPTLMYVKYYCVFFIGIGVNLFVSSNTYEENFIITSTGQPNIYPQNHNTYDKPSIKGRLILQLKKLQCIANFIMQIHNNRLNKVMGTVWNTILKEQNTIIGTIWQTLAIYRKMPWTMKLQCVNFKTTWEKLG